MVESLWRVADLRTRQKRIDQWSELCLGDEVSYPVDVFKGGDGP